MQSSIENKSLGDIFKQKEMGKNGQALLQNNGCFCLAKKWHLVKYRND
jgi:hypothetical protein